MRRTLLVCLALCTGGCSGEFILTAPDHVGLTGQNVPVVVRLQRREFWLYVPPSPDAALCFQMPDGPLKGARTDKQGYASVAFTMPDKPGKVTICIGHQDIKGDTCEGTASIYVLDRGPTIAAVDLDSLPTVGPDAEAAAQSLRNFQQQVSVIYTTQKYASDPATAHGLLISHKYPDSAVIPAFDKKDWMTMNRRRTSLSMIGVLKKNLPDLRFGLTSDAETALAMQRAGLEVVLVGNPSAAVGNAWRQSSWQNLQLPSAWQATPASQPDTRPAGTE